MKILGAFFIVLIIALGIFSCKKSKKLNPVFSDVETPVVLPPPIQPTTAYLTIQGAKWKNEMNGQDDAKSAKFETEGLTYDQAAKGISDAGIKSIVLKIAELKIMPAGTTLAMVHQEVIDMSKALKKYNVDVYLWQRQWLEKSGKDNGGADEYVDELAIIITKLKTAGVDDAVKGIAIIENNVETSESVLKYTLSITKKINDKTNGWLKNKTFLMPGAGMGPYFKGIDTSPSSNTFFSELSKQVNVFSFIYKHMESQDANVCA